MEGASRTLPSQPLATLAPKTASGGKIRARRFAPGWRADKPLYRFRKSHLCGQSGVGVPILANTIGNAVASQVSGSQDTTGQSDGHWVTQPGNNAAAGELAMADNTDGVESDIGTPQQRADAEALAAPSASPEIVVTATKEEMEAAQHGLGWDIADALGFHKGGFLYDLFHTSGQGQPGSSLYQFNSFLQNVNREISPTHVAARIISLGGSGESVSSIQSSLRYALNNPLEVMGDVAPAFGGSPFGMAAGGETVAAETAAVGEGSAAARFTFRGDSRGPDVIFNEGFAPRGNSTDLLAHAFDNTLPPSAYVSTSTSADVAAGFGDNVYVVRSTNGIDVNKVLGPASPYPNELEVAIPGGISPGNVRAVTIPSQGVSILNPNYVP